MFLLLTHAAIADVYVVLLISESEYLLHSQKMQLDSTWIDGKMANDS